MGNRGEIIIKKKDLIYCISVCAFIISAFAFAQIVAPPQKQTSNIIAGANLDEAIVLNQCDFYNFILKARNDPRRIYCPGGKING